MSQGLSVPDPAPAPETRPGHARAGAWWRVLLTGLGLYVVGLVLLVVTGNPNLFPTVVILGSFMVPATYVAFFYERRHLSLLSMPTTAFGFFWGGVLGVFAATILEPILLSCPVLGEVGERIFRLRCEEPILLWAAK